MSSPRELLELMLKVADDDVAEARVRLARAESHAASARDALIELDTLEAEAEHGRAAQDEADAAARGPRG